MWNKSDKFIDRLRNVQQSQIRNYDKKITSKIYRLKKQIMFLIKNLKNAKSKKKLFYQFIDFFEIVDVVDFQTYRFRLSKKWKIYFVFYVFFLKLYHENFNTTKSKNIMLVDENEKYKIEIILNHKMKWKKSHYLIR